MILNPRFHLAGAVVAAAGVLAPVPATAQQWSVYSGAAGRVEYNDNYFFVDPGQAASGNSGCDNREGVGVHARR